MKVPSNPHEDRNPTPVECLCIIVQTGVSVNERRAPNPRPGSDRWDLSHQDLPGKDGKIKGRPKKRQSPYSGLCLGWRVSLMVNVSTGSLWVSSDGLPFLLCFFTLS